MITRDQYLMGYDKAYGLYLSVEYCRNILRTLHTINSILSVAKVNGVELQGYPKCTKGWTPPGIFPYSLHTTCEAIDVDDPIGSLYQWLSLPNNLTLKDFGVWMQCDTPCYCHIQLKPYDQSRTNLERIRNGSPN